MQLDAPEPMQHVEIAASLVGQLIAGKYRVDRLIGIGGMGVVVSALHVDLERYVAIKFIRDELTRDQSAVQRFLLEARAAAKMTNEHVCRVLDVDKLDNGTPFIVMELLQGCDLAALLKERGRVAAAECVDWMLQACEGVAEAHALDIVHRDLKPDNLFMTRLGDGAPCIKVLDFGISKAISGNLNGSLTAPRTMVGSPRYMSPEQMLFSNADHRSDIWALGTILYELASGTPAFEGDSVATICSRVINERPVPPRARAPEVPPELQRVILRCLEREPSARYPSVAVLAQDLAPLGSATAQASARRIAATLANAARAAANLGAPLPHLPHVANPTALIGPTRTARTHRPRLWVGAALFFLTVLIGGMLSLRRHAEVADRRGAAAAPPAMVAPPSVDSELVQVVRAVGTAPAPAADPLREAVAERGAVARADDHRDSAARGAALPSAAPAPATDKRPAARRGNGPGSAGGSAGSSSSTSRRPDATTTSNLQEAWDVRKFGGRE